MIKYLGSKRLLVPAISQIAKNLPVSSACDLFAGTTRVGQGLRSAGHEVISNDLASYTYEFSQAYIVADESLDRERIQEILKHLSELAPDPGYFTETFCLKSRFFQPKNGARVDAIRNEIDNLDLNEVERGVVLTSLIEAADRVDSTVGLQMAYVKKWAKRAYNDLELREPEYVSGPSGSALKMDALELARNLECDLTYIDPPYNQHSYYSNYHIWETLVQWDKPEAYGVAQKRMDCKTVKSAYNSKRKAWDEFSALIETLKSPYLIVSFSNEGFHDPKDLEDLLKQKGEVEIISTDYKRYVGARLGIHNLQGEKVGEVSHLENKELIFVVGPERDTIEKATAELKAGAITDQRKK